MNRYSFTLIVLFAAIGLGLFQVFTTGPEIDANSPYSDAELYMEMAQFERWFGSTHATHRVVLPAVAGTLGKVFVPTGKERGLLLIFMCLNILLFTGGMHLFWSICYGDRKGGVGMIEILPLLLVFGVPFVWRSAFLPLLDTAAFFFTALLIFLFRQRSVVLFLLVLLLAAWTKEIILLGALFLPLIDRVQDRKWIPGYLMIVVVIGLYLAVTASVSGLESNYLLAPERWLSDFRSSVTGIGWTDLRYPLSALGAYLPLVLLIAISRFERPETRTGLLILGAAFLTFWIFTPTNSPRIMFMMIPYCYLFIRI